MASSYEKYQKRRLISSYFSVILSIFLVLFLLGSLCLFVINSKKISDNFRENIPMTIFIEKSTTKADLDKFGASLGKKNYIKEVKFVSKEDAAKEHQETLGEDFVEYLGFNPLQDSYDIHLKGEYVVNDSIDTILKELNTNTAISDIKYDKQLVDLVNENVDKVTQWVLILAAFLTVVSMLLINSSLRLLIFSSRFTIKTMQMVGATKRFIRRPFINHSMKLGIIGSILAIIAITALTFYADSKMPDLNINPKEDYMPLVIVSIGILVLGMLITSISTFFATQRFLNLKSDELY
ncbi:permease-like cell division protein FtsX [Myroides sp. M-43]|uniref:cell division protein FtsX n=1 Tax=Myroides oncorhynchi TaxID=2893756 RepID=UPI001E580772|nr:permease-like cell division protein FtsX [Myroides oncorhynchi]MCC9042646.1 permease-like cell division protein FtsX [Myroides oncorhynchi]